MLSSTYRQKSRDIGKKWTLADASKWPNQVKGLITGRTCLDARCQSVPYVEDVKLRAKEEQLAHRADVNYSIIDPNLC